jgi:hypothetical protein
MVPVHTSSTVHLLLGTWRQNVVRHHAAENVSSSFSFIPVVDVSTHTFGGSIVLRPGQLDMAKIGRFVNRMRPKNL